MNKNELRALYGADNAAKKVNDIRLSNPVVKGYEVFMRDMDKAENTIVNSISQLGNMLEYIAAKKNHAINEDFINNLSIDDFNNYFRTIIKSSKSKRYFKLMVAKEFFDYHLKKEWHLAEKFKVKRSRSKAIFTMEHYEVKPFMSVIDNDTDKIFFGLLVGSGLRREEARFLFKSNIDLKNYEVRVLATELHTPKDLIEGTTVLSKKTADIIQAYQRPVATDQKWEPLLLLNPKGKPLSMSTMRAKFIRYCKKAKIRRNLSMHKLRSTFCGLMARSGYSLEQTHVMVRHSDIRTTQRYYTDLAKHITVRNAKSPLDTYT